MSTRRQRWAAMATGRAAVPVRRDLRNCAPCRGKLLATMKAEIAQTAAHTLKPLNAKLQSRPDFIPAAPRTEVVKLPGHTVLYDVHSMAAVEVDDKRIEQPGWVQSLHEHGLNCAEKPQFRFFHQTECLYLILEATHACNLACQYCFVRNYYPEQGGMMTMDTARKAIDLLSPKQPVSVGFFGGEPLLNWDLIAGVTAYAKDLAAKRGVASRLHITTNATLLDEERIRFLDANGFSLIVSLDGPEEMHNRMRPGKSAALNSQQATVANLRKFKGRGLALRTTLRSTFTGAGIEMLPRIEYLNALIEDGCASHMSVEACSLNETACLRLPDGHPLAITPAHYDALAQEYHLAANWYVAQVRAGKRPSLQQFAWALRRLLYTQHSCTECGAGCGYLSVDPDGHLFACHREGKSVIGHLDTGVDEELRAKWKDNRFYARPDCIVCPIKYLCGGGCRMNSLDRHNDIRRPDEMDCFLKRRMFEEALWIMCELGPETLRAIFPG
ncbi:MAG: radical SAM protein [Candidatus Brocadiia bacterium]